MRNTPKSIDAAALDQSLALVRSHAAGSEAGVFGPNSQIWRIDREAAAFLGAGRALLMQLAHPWVATAIAQHSTALGDPIGRFHRTFQIVFTLVFGSLDQALSVSRRLHLRLASEGLAVGRNAREIAAHVLSGAGHVPVPRWYGDVTAGLVPESLRHAFRLPYDEREQRRAKRALRLVRLQNSPGQGYHSCSETTALVRLRRMEYAKSTSPVLSLIPKNARIS